jgi:hypothetical protein
MIVTALVKQKPEELIAWLRNEAMRDKALITALAEFMDERAEWLLLASISLVTMETVDAVTRLLKSRTKATGLLHGISDRALNLAVRKAVLFWIGGNRQNMPKQDMIKELLLLVYSEVTGRNKDEIKMEEWAMLPAHTDKDIQESILSQTDWSVLSVLLKDAGRSDADKRIVISILVQNKPEAFLSWLRTGATNDGTLMTMLAGLMDEKILRLLLASVSLEAMGTVDEVMEYLIGLVKENSLADGLSYKKFTLAFRKAVLLWITNDNALSGNDSPKSLLQEIHKEITGTTGKNYEAAVEEWTEGFHLLENEAKVLRIFTGQGDNELKESIRRLRTLLAAGNIAETVKRRVVIFFLERHKDSYANVIWELHEQGLLGDTINLISLPATESVIRQMIARCIGAEEAEKLLLLTNQLLADENTVSAYLRDKSLTLRTQVFIWLAKETKVHAGGTAKSFAELFPLFLAFLFGKENMTTVIRLVVYGTAGEVTTDEVKDPDILEIIDLLPYIGSSRVRRAISMFEQWSQHIKVYSSTVQTLLENRWNTSDDFMEWLKDTEVTTGTRRELLQALAWGKPRELVGLLRHLPKDEEAVSLTAIYIPTEVLMAVVEKADTKQALLLSRTVDLLQRERGRFSFLSSMTLSFTTALSEALLLFMQDNDTLDGRNLTEQEVIGKFLAHLYYVYTRRTDYNGHAEWKHLQDEVTDGLGLNGTETTSVPVSEDAISERLLSEYNRLTDSELYYLVTTILDKQRELFVELSEKNPGTDFIRRISGIADSTMLRRMVTTLSSVSGFENHTAFIKLMEWLGIRSVDRIPVSDWMSALLSWISTANWKTQTARQMTSFFLSRLYGSDDTANLPLEMLADDTLPEEIRKRMLHGYMRSRPAELLSHIQQLVAQGKLPMDKWAEWAELSEWLRLIASVSLTLEELLRQVVECLLSQNKSADETVLRYGVATFIATNDAVKFACYVDKAEVVCTFILSLPSIQGKTAEEKKEAVDRVMKDLGIMPVEERLLEGAEEDSEIALVGNAGLCLLSPWFPRLFALLGYLDGENRNFRNTASRIRAVFLLQYLACPEEKDYREPELAFNRLLVALPAQVPLPKRMELTDEERRTADNMLAGVKANWPKMDGTSVSGFRQSFILRDGRLEQQDEKWLLTVESRVYDIMLDAVPWAFRQIRFPWLKKYIQVSWHEKQEF